MAVLWTGYCPENTAVTAVTLNQRGVPTYRDARMCLRAVRTAVDYAEFLQRFAQRPSDIKRDVPAEAPARARQALAQASRVVPERVSKQALAAYGLAVTREMLAHTADEAVQAAATIGGAVALKIESADVPHKTEAGGVRLSLQGDAAIRAAYDEILASVCAHAPKAKLDGVLVQEMAPRGVEMMLGVTRDVTFGTVVSVALGGVHVEVLRDIAHGIAPLNHGDAQRMVDSLAGRRLLDGVRGAPACDVEALCDAIVRLSWFACDLGAGIAELDINPLIVLPRGQGVKIVDALIVKS
jgi:acyl-CoA synthetase (NDP forming)